MDFYFGKVGQPKPIIFRNVRGFNFTRNLNKGGTINVSLDYSETSEQIDVGWHIQVKHNDKLVFNGMVYSVADNKGKVKINGVDLAGMVDKRNIYQLANFSQEASTDVIEKLNGLELIKGITISADDHIDVTGTEEAWHGENVSLGKYITDIGNQSVGLSGNKVPFNWWVRPDAKVLFQQHGAGKLHVDLPTRDVARKKDLNNTFNYVIVRGLPLHKLPYDGDMWTETSVDMWDTTGGGGSVASMSSAFAYVGIQSVKFSTDGCGGLCLGQIISLRKSLLYQGEGIVLENLESVNFALLTTDGYNQWIGYNVHFAGSSGSFTYVGDVDLVANNTWKSYSISGTPYATTGTGLLTPITSVTITINMLDGGFAASDVHFDNFYLNFTPYEYQTDDQDSIDNNGRLDKTLIAKQFITNAECQNLAEDLLAKYKDPKLKYSMSIDGFYDIYPNDTIRFKYKGSDVESVVKSATYYDTTDGSISMQIICADALVLNIDEIILKKFAEINTNTYLDANPYRIG